MIIARSHLIIIILLGAFSFKAAGQYCIPSYTTVCISPGVNDFIDNFWTTGAIGNITNMNSSCNMLPDNYIYYSNMAVVVNPGSTFQVHMQCSHTYQQGFVIWVDWD
nr:hypothetical protein [Bacteroidota bacterium]